MEMKRDTEQNGETRGLVIVNTGDGKGKTTAALGLMMRAWGREMKVGMVQFIKNEKRRTGELEAAERIGIEWHGSGDGWTWKKTDLQSAEDRALQGWEVARERIACSGYDVLILDEFTYPLHFGWLDVKEVINWLRENKPAALHLVITGRYAPSELIEYADLVTEMREIKHPLSAQGIGAQAGIEY
jgi:cob(I)alamin adenosyltransferase